jgi:hypothetical protein
MAKFPLNQSSSLSNLAGRVKKASEHTLMPTRASKPNQARVWHLPHAANRLRARWWRRSGWRQGHVQTTTQVWFHFISFASPISYHDRSYLSLMAFTTGPRACSHCSLLFHSRVCPRRAVFVPPPYYLSKLDRTHNENEICMPFVIGI